MSEAEVQRCYWCGATPPCPPRQHRDPDAADYPLDDDPECHFYIGDGTSTCLCGYPKNAHTDEIPT